MKIKMYSKGQIEKTIDFDGNYNLDRWNGHSWCFKNEAWRHASIQKIDDEFVIIFGDDTEGHQTYAEKITRKQAKKMIMEYKPELFEENEFKELYGDRQK